MADDQQWIISHLAKRADIIGRSSNTAAVTVFSQQRNVDDAPAVVTERICADSVQSLPKRDGSYDGKKKAQLFSSTVTVSN